MKNQKNTPTQETAQDKHIPVLMEAVLEFLSPKPQESYLDLTAGYGGHAKEILGRTLRPQKATLVDRDQNAVKSLRQQFTGGGVQIIHQDFLGASLDLLGAGKKFDIILADLGVSSPHLDNASRGFSFSQDGPLDMRMDQSQSLSAATIVNTFEEKVLTRLLREYGEEPRASKIARLIEANRPITTTHELAKVVKRAWPGHSKTHPATRTFQALRLAVNSELEQLEKALSIWVELLAPGGRIAIISFHSLEDRIVKQGLKDVTGDRYDAPLRLLTKQPVGPGRDEIVSNPRARSAKLRAAAKINTNIERGVAYANTG